MDQELFLQLGIALGLGLLVGLQREYDNSDIAGIRTFPLITILGTVCAFLAQSLGTWVVVAGFLSLAGLVIGANLLKIRSTKPGSGQTTEVAVLLMFAVGAYLAVGEKTVAVAIGGATAVLLHFKLPLVRLVERMGEKNLRVIMQFVLISLVILPVLPNETYGPYDVLNPHDIWLMVVLIVGIGISGYFAYKLFGKDAGTLLGGLLGGLISSTATTVSYSRRTQDAPDLNKVAAFVIVAASTVAFVRVIVEIAVVAPQSFGQMAPPLGAVLVLMLLLSAGLYWWGNKRQEKEEMPEQENPAQLKSALIFGALYALVLLGIEAAKDYFGNAGLYAIALLSGLTDVDAITLSTSRLVNDESLAASMGWRLILVASLANLAFKGGMVAVLGTKKLLIIVAVPFGIAIAGGVLALWLWPEGLSF
jgi:uncharacterized membrane protein (DUF4010 family)